MDKIEKTCADQTLTTSLEIILISHASYHLFFASSIHHEDASVVAASGNPLAVRAESRAANGTGMFLQLRYFFSR